jgi:hypothetical protein
VKDDEKGSMPKQNLNLKDKRKHERYPAKLGAQLRISLSSRDTGKIIQGIQNIIAMAETNDISIGGMSLRIVGSAMDARKSLTPANATRLVGRPIEVVLDKENLIIWGDVVRTEANTLELAIVIYKVSDVKQWKQLCSQNDDGISIFPDSLALRRRKRA